MDITKKYLKDIITEINDTKKCANEIFDFSKLKYRERDSIIERLEFWVKLTNDVNYL